MKKQISSLVLSILFGVGVVLAAPQQPADQPAPPQHAVETGHRQPDPQREVHMLSKRLNLTADQQSQILPILTNRAQQIESLRADTSLSAKDRHAKLRSVRQDGEAQIRALLNDSQKQAFDQMQQQMHEREQQRREQRQNTGAGAL